MAMIVITASYLFVELAFNFTLIRTLGSIDFEKDRITLASISGMTEMGRRLTATMVALFVLGFFANNYVKDQPPWPLLLLRKLFSPGRASPRWEWRAGSFLFAATALAGIWFATHRLEDEIFEFQAWMAPPQERQNVHIALNATKVALAAAKIAASSPNGVVEPVSLDVRDPCLAVPRAREGSVRLDAAFLAQPGARPLIASLPHLLSTRWQDANITIAEQRCEIAARWRTMLPSPQKSYSEARIPQLMHSLERAYDPNGKFATPPPGIVEEPDLRTWLAISNIPVGRAGLSQALVDGCMAGRARLDYPGLICLWKGLHAEARRFGTEAGFRYRSMYLERRAGTIAEYQSQIDALEAGGAELADNFGKMEEADRARILPTVRGEAERNSCLVELDIVEQSVPESLDGINSCEQLGSKIKSLADKAVRDRYCALNDGYCGVSEWWYGVKTSGASEFESRAKRACSAQPPNEIVEKCRSAVRDGVAERAREARGQLEAIPLDPREGIYAALKARLDELALGEPAQWPFDIQERLRAASNRMMAGALAPDRRAAERVALTALDALPACESARYWIDGHVAERLTDFNEQRQVSRKLAELPWCDTFRSVIAAAGRRAFEHAEALPKLRAEVRQALAMALWENGAADRSRANMLAELWIGQDWMPQTEQAFARTIEHGIIANLIRPLAIDRISAAGKIDLNEAERFLDRPPESFAALLGHPVFDRRAREELNVMLGGFFAYAGLSEDQIGRVRLTRPLRTDLRENWEQEIYRPLIDRIEKTVLQSRLIGDTADYDRVHSEGAGFLQHLSARKEIEGGRCFEAGEKAYYAALLPTLGLGLSILGLLLHSCKLTLFTLKLVPLRKRIRFPLSLCVPTALVLLPVLAPPPIMEAPLARDLFRPASLSRPSSLFLPWMIAAQARFEGLSSVPYGIIAGDDHLWDLGSLADATESRDHRAQVEQALGQDRRIVELRNRWPVLATEQSNNKQLAELRHMLDNQFLCTAPRVKAQG
ncbi:hypothetical protein Q9Q95_11470 [Sphingomonas sp. DG1-23]|uniref:hypothetical protein n=1 Tax=Sphingomonas sp. DG1-23 TaxID=3068316 RepID=UPI00273D4FD2|nr:hypothetical protein [Sphingomonas sp. DG1-23]MDP5279543.1 hypothetical protein [Sphingomonas sp. DG1-23]